MTILTPTSPNYLADGAWTIVGNSVGQVSGANGSFDTGSGSTRWDGILVANVNAIATTNGQTYSVLVQGSNAANFSSGVQTLCSFVPVATGQQVVPLYSIINQVNYRYFRLYTYTNGTSPSINITAFVQPLTALSDMTLDEVTQVFGIYADNWQGATSQFLAWMTGTATGGDGAGNYPLSNGNGTTVLVACPAAISARAASTVLYIPTFQAFQSTVIPSSVKRVRTGGWWTENDGGHAEYKQTSTADINSYSNHSSNGVYFTLDEDFPSPCMTGGMGDGTSRPASTRYASLSALQVFFSFAPNLDVEVDWLAWQALCLRTGRINGKDQTYLWKMCNGSQDSQQMLTVVAGETWGLSAGCTLDFSSLTVRTSTNQYITNPTFTSSTGWENAPQYTSTEMIQTVFGPNGAVMTDTSNYPTQTSFYQWGQEVTLQPGKYTISATCECTLGASYAAGNGQPANGGIGFFEYEPGTGLTFSTKTAGLTGLSAIFAGEYTEVIGFDFIVDTAVTFWVTFSGSGYLSCTVTSLTIVDWIGNAGLQLTRDNATLHYPQPQPFGGFYLNGPGAVDGSIGLMYKSFDDIDGNLVMLENCTIQYWGTGMELGDGVYLLQVTNVNIGGNVGISFPKGLSNAGENNRWYGGAIGGGLSCLDNPGGSEFTFYGTAFDYTRQIMTNQNGKVELHGCHVEMEEPYVAGLPLFDIYGGGRISMFGGVILLAGAAGQGLEPPIRFNTATDKFCVYGTEIYNLSSAAGVACEGPGTFSAPGGWRNGGNPNLGHTLLSTAVNMDVLAGMGSFEPPSTSTPFAVTVPSGISLQGYIYCSTPTNTITNNWQQSDATAVITTDYAHSGSHSLKYTRDYGSGTGNEFCLCWPIKPEQDFWLQMYYYFPENHLATGEASTLTETVYVRLWFAQVNYFDSNGRPVFGLQSQFRGEEDWSVPIGGMTDWTQFLWTTSYGSAGAPAWANYAVLTLDFESIRQTTMYIDDIVVNVL